MPSFTTYRAVNDPNTGGGAQKKRARSLRRSFMLRPVNTDSVSLLPMIALR
jgi:hypothetical protein